MDTCRRTEREAEIQASIYICKCMHTDGQTGRLTDELLNGQTGRQRDIQKMRQEGKQGKKN